MGKKKNKTVKVFADVISYILGSAFNIAVFAATVLFVVTFATKGFDFGKSFVRGETTRNEPKEVVLTIPDDFDATDIAKILKENEMISNETLFLLQTKLNGTDELFKPGVYRLNMAMTENELMEALQSTEFVIADPEERVTIPEGLTLQQVAQLLESKEFIPFTAEEFLAACENVENYNFGFIADIPDRTFRLQGYLFPDTYFLQSNPTPEQVIGRMLARFENIFTYEYMQIADEMGLTMDEVITMASIIEKEIRVPEERELASAVIHNRMAVDMRLEMCSTVLYALDKSRERLLLEDLEVDSPYNTYRNSGLPLGPIACPGEASIRAVLFPEKCDYLFFVLKNPETGEHFFTDNYDGFLQAKAQYNDLF